MVLRIDLPDDVSRQLEDRWGDLPRHVLETLAIEGYRDGTLSQYQVQRMLGLDSRFAVDEFMKQRGIPMPYNAEDLERDAENLAALPPVPSE